MKGRSYSSRFIQASSLVAGLAIITAACGSNGPAPGSFELVGDWQGDLESTSQVNPGAIGDFVITLVGEEDGEVEEYSGEGTFTGNQAIRRFRNVQGEYNTATGEIEIVILDFFSVGNTFRGNFDGGSLFIADSTICACEALLTREDPADDD